MRLRAELQEKPRPNLWTRRWQACSVLAVANMVRGILWPQRGWDVLLAVVLFSALAGCCAMHIRTGRAIRVARETAELKAREAATLLRTPRAPDAGPDQCPVCGGYGLDALAKDDAFMERGALAKVVAWGSRRAHWDCAEWSPYVRTEAEVLRMLHDPATYRAEPNQHFEPFETDGHMTYCACPRCSKSDDGHRAYSRCTFCGFYQFGPSKDAAAEKLIAHAKECTKRPRPTVREINTKAAELGAQISDLDTRVAAAATRVSIDSARLTEVLRMLGKGF